MIGSKGSEGFEKVWVTVRVILTVCVKVSVESVVESLVSRYENRFTASPQLTEENALKEMIISENGPNLHEANGILEHALNELVGEKLGWEVAFLSAQEKTEKVISEDPVKL